MTRLADVVATSGAVASTSSRLAKVAALAARLTSFSTEEVEAGVAFLIGVPLQGKLGVGGAALHEASRILPATGATLELMDVHRGFDRILGAAGRGSAGDRARLLAELFGRATLEERDFLVRLLIGELRQGASEGIMSDAIARATGLEPRLVRRAAMLAGSLPRVARAAFESGESGLQAFSLELFRPILPMLAQPSEEVDDILGQLGTAAFEWKIDGARVQAHKLGDDVRLYSRNLNEVTDAAPEVAEAVRAATAHSLVIDGEVIALAAQGAPHPFQLTMRRFGRRLDVAALRAELPLTLFAFDCLYRDGVDLLSHATQERYEALQRALPEALVPRIVTGAPEEAKRFLDAALAHGHEGVMAKALDAPYEAGRRGASWFKLKRAHTLDLVVLAAEWGNGRRQGWLSNLHLGARDPAGGFVMIGKTFKGLTDETLAWQTEAFLEREERREGHVVHVRPELVVEVAFNNVQESSQYQGGLALRFARVKGYRPDKSPAEADTIDTVRELWQREQRATQGTGTSIPEFTTRGQRAGHDDPREE